MGMAGEVIKQIKDRESEASELIAEAHADAKKLLERTRDEKTVLIEKKNNLLEKEEEKIREKYAGETADIVKQIEEEEKRTVQKLTTACEKNIGRVVDFISSEIVKE
jgi:vacuolar-type H+-ATPase subunit H